jgi:hypothetical protein
LQRKLFFAKIINWFASQACKPKLPVDRHIQSHCKISIYNISNWLSILGETLKTDLKLFEKLEGLEKTTASNYFSNNLSST